MYGTAQSNLMPACRLAGKHVRVNLQTGAGTGSGACNDPHQPNGHPFRSRFLNTLILTVVRATFAALFIYTVVCESLSESSRIIID